MDRPVVYWERMSKGDNHRGGGHGVYFDDPDGHIFELLTVGAEGYALCNSCPASKSYTATPSHLSRS
ncbi:hypothetical protein BH20PSE1_BH20PSE1_12460 [soil metagenome]